MITEISSTPIVGNNRSQDGEDDTDDVGRGNNTNKTESLERRLQACREAVTTPEHEESWKAFTEALVIEQQEEQDWTLTTAQYYARQVLVEFPYCSKIYCQHMIRFYHKCGRRISIYTCCSLLKELASTKDETLKHHPLDSKLPHAEILKACWAILQRTLLSREQHNDDDDDVSTRRTTNDCYDRPMVQLILTIPSLMGNACHVCQFKLPLLATPTKFYPRLVECSSSGADRVAIIRSLLSTRNNAEAIAVGLARQHPLLDMGKVSWSGRELGHLILAFLQQHLAQEQQEPVEQGTNEDTGTNKVLLTCEQLFRSASVEDQEYVAHHIVLQSRPFVVDLCLCPLFVTLLKRCEILQATLMDIAEAWSEWSFCQDISTPKQHFVSRMLLQGMEELEEEEFNDALISELLQGVTHRLESTVSQIRLDGMRIARHIAIRSQQELHFEELEAAEQKEVTEVVSTTAKEDSQEAPLVINKKTKRRRKVKPVIIDPDAEFDSDEEEIEEGSVNSDGDDDSLSLYDEELVPFNLEDDEEDLLQTPKPMYLLKALELLQTGENDEHAYSHHETALRALPELVRKRPDDLPDVAISLVLQLIRMENKFGIDNFLSLRQDSIVALCVMEAVVAGKQLTEEAFNEYPLSDRLACFGALQQAAYELSGHMAQDKASWKDNSEVKSSVLKDKQESLTTLSEKQIVRVQSKTRRKRSIRVVPSTIKNNFTAVAPMWFYSIIGEFLKEKDNESIWAGSTGSHLLSGMIQTLAVIVEFAGPACAPLLAGDLIDFSSSFLGADVAEVRLAILIAVSTSFSVMLDDQVLGLLLKSGDSLAGYITTLAHSDPDVKCRELATGISHLIGDVVKQSRPLM